MANDARAARAPTRPKHSPPSRGRKSHTGGTMYAGPKESLAPPENPDRRRCVGGPIGGHQDEGTATFRRGRAVKQMKWVGHHA